MPFQSAFERPTAVGPFAQIMHAAIDQGIAQDAGRHPDDLKIFMGISVIVAPTESEAQEKHREYLRYASPEAGVAHFSSSIGIDLEQHALGDRYALIVGNPSQVAEALINWLDEGGIDGFNLTRIVNPQSYIDFIDLVVPELQLRGRYKTACQPGTFRKKLFGDDRLVDRHPAARGRITSRDPL